MLTQYPIYTIGHGNRTIKSFFDILHNLEIQFLIDVRSNPFSKYYPQYNRAELELNCKSQNISYVYMGDGLGGRPKDRSCFDANGHVLYEIIMHKLFFLKAIDRLKTAYAKNLRVVCMCSELDPWECHRSKLIGRFLETQNICTVHIDRQGRLLSQQEVINQATGGYEVDLFGNQFEFKSKGAY